MAYNNNFSNCFKQLEELTSRFDRESCNSQLLILNKTMWYIPSVFHDAFRLVSADIISEDGTHEKDILCLCFFMENYENSLLIPIREFLNNGFSCHKFKKLVTNYLYNRFIKRKSDFKKPFIGSNKSSFKRVNTFDASTVKEWYTSFWDYFQFKKFIEDVKNSKQLYYFVRGDVVKNLESNDIFQSDLLIRFGKDGKYCVKFFGIPSSRILSSWRIYRDISGKSCVIDGPFIPISDSSSDNFPYVSESSIKPINRDDSQRGLDAKGIMRLVREITSEYNSK